MFEKLSTSDILFISSLYYTSTHIVESLITIENNLFSARKTRISFIQDQMLNEYRCELCMYILYRLLNVDNPSVKWSDWLCEVIELGMQSCGKLLSNSFETYKTFWRSVNPEFERKFDVQNSYFGSGYVFLISRSLP